MLRFRTNLFDDPFVMTNSESNPERGNKIEGSVCEHLAGIKILDVKRNLMFDVASNPTLHGSGNGSVSNMLLHGKFTESAVREGCSGNFEEEKKNCIILWVHCFLRPSYSAQDIPQLHQACVNWKCLIWVQIMAKILKYTVILIEVCREMQLWAIFCISQASISWQQNVFSRCGWHFKNSQSANVCAGL